MSENYDLVILGGGMGGYVAAIRARQLGLSVALVEANLVGGTCLHQGCIPTKTLLKSASVYQTIINSRQYGIETKEPKIHFPDVQAKKEEVVNQLYQGLQFLMKKNKIKIYNGFGRLLGPSIFSPMAGAVSVEYLDDQENTILIGENVLIATGTKVKSLKGFSFDQEHILSSEDILNMETLPKSMTIIGGGVIGVEFASMLSDFNVKVTLVESQKSLLPEFDHELSEALERNFKKKGINVITDAIVTDQKVNENSEVKLTIKAQEEQTEIITEKVLVAIGRSANVDDLGLTNTDIETDQAGFIKVNSAFQTKESHIYAVGDCIGGKQLAHVAAHEGKLAVEHIVGKTDKLNQQSFAPSCVYSQPEVATVGMSEQEANEQGVNYKAQKMSLSSIGKSLINGDASGFCKMIIDQETNDLIGVHLIGNQVNELISEAGLALLLNATASEIGLAIHPHPSLSEVIQEVALGMIDEPAHS